MNPIKDSFKLSQRFIPLRLISTPNTLELNFRNSTIPVGWHFHSMKTSTLTRKHSISPLFASQWLEKNRYPKTMVLGHYLCELIYWTEFLNNSINSAKQRLSGRFWKPFSFFKSKLNLLRSIALYLASNSSKERIGNKTLHDNSEYISSCQRTDPNLWTFVILH